MNLIFQGLVASDTSLIDHWNAVKDSVLVDTGVNAYDVTYAIYRAILESHMKAKRFVNQREASKLFALRMSRVRVITWLPEIVTLGVPCNAIRELISRNLHSVNFLSMDHGDFRVMLRNAVLGETKLIYRDIATDDVITAVGAINSYNVLYGVYAYVHPVLVDGMVVLNVFNSDKISSIEYDVTKKVFTIDNGDEERDVIDMRLYCTALFGL